MVRGAVRFWCGPLLIGEVSLAISVRADLEPDGASMPERAPMYRKIFPSYSHLDLGIVEGFEDAARALGDRYLQDVLALRAGEHWQPRLLELIADADVFQLFWSSNSMRSPYCQQEWEHALALGRPLFVRPLYWEDPLPEDMALGLPPAGLRELHFVRVRPGTEQPGDLEPDAAPSLLVRTRRSDHHMQAGTTYRVGRDPDADIAFTDSRVSWRHGVLRADGGRWVFEDTGSRNGTFIGTEQVDQITIDGDRVLRLGDPEDGPILRCIPQAAAAPGPSAPQGPATGVTQVVPFQPPTPAVPEAPAPDQGWYQQGGPQEDGYGAPADNDSGYGSPGYGTPGYGAPGYGAPGYGGPGYGAAGYGPPGSPAGPQPGPAPSGWAPPGAPQPSARSSRRAVVTVAVVAFVVAAVIAAVILTVLH